MIPGARHRDVHEAAFFLRLFERSETASGREPSVDAPDDEDCIPLLTLGRVGCAKNEIVLVFLAACSREILRCLRWLERERRKKRRTIRIAGCNVLELVEIHEPWLGLVV